MRLRRWGDLADGETTYDRIEIAFGPPGGGHPLAVSCVLGRTDEAELRDRIRALDRAQLIHALNYLALSARGWGRTVEPAALVQALALAEATGPARSLA